ncbi:uncharacterized protein LOC131985141 [Centropristis striata]|uniref:uncharacterized protein LOC131985141 n=1 Tax=Centropristis striata TaxID=184440 RepID=UPI0027DF515A|nr:uncharacterized protein LOC131985141 [Centropristis striata]
MPVSFSALSQFGATFISSLWVLHMGKSRDLSEFERGMIVGARRAGYSISETANRLGFSRTGVSRVYREWCEKQKTSSERGSCGRKRLVDDNGERTMERVVEANNHATTEQIQALYNSSGQERSISLTTTRRTLKRLGYSRGTRDSTLVLAGLDALAEYTSSSDQQEDTSFPHLQEDTSSSPHLQEDTSFPHLQEEDTSSPHLQEDTSFPHLQEDTSSPHLQEEDTSTDLVCSKESDPS